MKFIRSVVIEMNSIWAGNALDWRPDPLEGVPNGVITAFHGLESPEKSLKERRAFVTCSTKYASLHDVSLPPQSACSLALCQRCSACNIFANKIIDDSSVHCVSPKPDTAMWRCHNGGSKCKKTKKHVLVSKLLVETKASPLSNSCKEHD
jgi:hypothetical protein